MGRTEHYRDPDAPPATRIVVAAQAFVQDDAGLILLIQRSDNGLWAPPGGAQSIGERVGDAAVRETKEETGYDIEAIGMVGIIGRLAPGYAADIIALDGDPLQDITAVRRVVFVMRGGKIYKWVGSQAERRSRH